MIEYEEALGEPRARLGGLELCQFLKEAWGKLHGGPSEDSVVTGDGAKKDIKKDAKAKAAEFELGGAGMLGLVDRDDIIKMLSFAAKDMWADHLKKNQKGGWHLHKFQLSEYLEGV